MGATGYVASVSVAEHSMAETISMALRVAEETVDEAIAKAESQTDNKVLILSLMMSMF